MVGNALGAERPDEARRVLWSGIALCLAVPVAFLAARNTTPSALFVRPIALLIIVSTRSINSLRSWMRLATRST